MNPDSSQEAEPRYLDDLAFSPGAMTSEPDSGIIGAEPGTEGDDDSLNKPDTEVEEPSPTVNGGETDLNEPQPDVEEPLPLVNQAQPLLEQPETVVPKDIPPGDAETGGNNSK